MNQKTVSSILILAILASFAIIYYTFQNNSSPKPATTAQKTLTPTPTRDVTPVPVTIRTGRGKIVAVNATSVSVQAGTKTEVYTLNTKTEIYKLTGGTLEGGNAQTALVTAANLAVGQEVMVIADKNSPTVQRIVIVK